VEIVGEDSFKDRGARTTAARKRGRERFEAGEAAGIESFEDRERGHEEGASATGGIEDSRVLEERVEGRKEIGISALIEGIDSQSEKIEVISDAVVDRSDEARMQDVAQKGRASLALVILAPGFLRVIEGRAKRRRDEAVGGGGEELPERGSWSES